MMKLRTTTPASISQKAKKGMLIAIAALVLIGSGTVYLQTRPASADQYDDKIRALQADMNRYQAEANRLNSEAISLKNTIAQITNQKNALQARIDVNQAKHDKLVIEIADTEKQIKENQDALGTTLADLYVDDSISPVEMLASSQNIGDFLDKQTYRNSVKDQLSSTIKKVKDLKESLTKKQADVKKVLAEQKSARDDLKAKESEQATLLAQTQNDESKFQGMISANKKEIAKARAAQRIMQERANSTGGATVIASGSLGEYTSLWAPNSCWMGGPGGWYSYGGANGNGGDGRGYGCRQCASYVAWKIAKETNIYYKWGNGGQFAGRAIAAGYKNLGGNPQPGSIAVMWGDPGHVAWVEAVSGNQVLVSQYNWQINGQYGMYSEMWLNKSVFDQYVKITP
jgi:peptidoglycan hydrolase CwlO-like protein